MSTVQDELMHYGVLGMKWGQRKTETSTYKNSGLSKKDYKERRKLDNRSAKEVTRIYRTNDPRVKNRISVLNKQNRDRMANKELSEKWAKAFVDGEGSKSMKEYRKASLDFNSKYTKAYVDAWLKDNRMTKISDINRQYMYDVAESQRPTGL